MSEILRRTPLFPVHQELGARFVGFGGWEMPVQYSGVIEEHLAVRNAVGLFDVSHMGEIFVSGSEALSFLQYLTPNDVSKLEIGRAQYSLLTLENGASVDDIIIYRTADQEYLICVNAANIEKDFAWLKQHQRGAVVVDNQSAAWAQIAIQGPRAVALTAQVFGMPAAKFEREHFPYFSFQKLALTLAGAKVETIVARTGYTGEDGFEVFLPAGRGADLFRELIRSGAAFGVKPAGLGARDTLRLEAALPLYGHELSPERNILEANLGWVVKLEKGEFLGREVLQRTKTEGAAEKLVGLELLEPGIAREHCAVFSVDGSAVGETTSGTKTPTLNKSIALAYVAQTVSALDTDLEVEVRGKRLRARVVKLPFYKRTA